MRVDLVDWMGSDLTVVNAARVSFDKESHWENEDGASGLLEKDQRLLAYLARHGHWSPFAHPVASFRINAPIAIARQLVKHQVGLTWNEVSRRYVDSPPAYFVPDAWRSRAEDKKQGSGGPLAWDWTSEYLRVVGEADALYKRMLRENVCPEQARLILPLGVMTEWIWTGSLYAFHRVYKQRTHDGAQEETKQIALMIGKEMEKLFPFSWAALSNNE